MSTERIKEWKRSESGENENTQGVSVVSTERIKEWKMSESGENENSSREMSYHS